ncbi:MAG: hypothetical protein SPL35_05915 [Bacteroidales bacterium]|nr:hypothetical protein [Bacteroidales bacterium]
MNKLLIVLSFAILIPVKSFSQDYLNGIVSAYNKLDTLYYRSLIQSAITRDSTRNWDSGFFRAAETSTKKLYLLKIHIDIQAFREKHTLELSIDENSLPFNIIYMAGNEITYYLYTYHDGVDNVAPYACNPIFPFFPFRHKRAQKHKEAIKLILKQNPEYILWPENIFDSYVFVKNNQLYAIDVLKLKISTINSFLENYQGYKP